MSSYVFGSRTLTVTDIPAPLVMVPSCSSKYIYPICSPGVARMRIVPVPSSAPPPRNVPCDCISSGSSIACPVYPCMCSGSLIRRRKRSITGIPLKCADCLGMFGLDTRLRLHEGLSLVLRLLRVQVRARVLFLLGYMFVLQVHR